VVGVRVRVRVRVGVGVRTRGLRNKHHGIWESASQLEWGGGLKKKYKNIRSTGGYM
jgi:hypothetical protein